MTVYETLMSQARAGTLAHFFIVECPLPENQAFAKLCEFAQTFIRDYYLTIEQQKMLQNFLQHPDVLVIGNLPETEEKETANFTVEESSVLARFLEFRSVQARRKFVVITEGHRINPTVANKWLKLLEEPQGEVTIFLLNPRRQKLLDTIHSRALHLRIVSPGQVADQSVWKEFLETVKGLSLSQFLEKYSKAEHDLNFWTGHLLHWESEICDEPLKKAALAQWLKKLQEMELFHQPTATKWTLFYSFLQQHVISRASH
jgi:hypothetical protein